MSAGEAPSVGGGTGVPGAALLADEQGTRTFVSQRQTSVRA